MQAVNDSEDELGGHGRCHDQHHRGADLHAGLLQQRPAKVETQNHCGSRVRYSRRHKKQQTKPCEGRQGLFVQGFCIMW